MSVGILSLAAWLTASPFVFPSLGPTAFMLFLFPQSSSSSPRDCLLGHGIGILCGYFALLATGLAFVSEAPPHDVSLPRVLAAALSLGATSAAMILLKINHAPACATTLIVALGIITRPQDLLLMEFSVFLLVLQAFVLNRAFGFSYPIWQAREHEEPGQAG